MPNFGLFTPELFIWQAISRGGGPMNPASSGREDVFVVAGPTGSGKTALALALAERWNAEIISADACQVYRGLAVLTAQPTPEELARTRHYLVGDRSPEVDFSAVDFARAAEEAMAEIRGRRKRVLLVGGAGFYLETLLDGNTAAPPPDADLRAELRTLTLEEMLARLRSLDPAAAESVDKNNPRRIQRAIEIVASSGRPFASFSKESDLSWRGVVLDWPREILQKRLEIRVDEILKNGAIDEVRNLGACGATCGKTIGLREISDFLAGKSTLAECRERMNIATRQYAKRQRTWFRNRGRWETIAPEDFDHIQPFPEAAD